jgi:hypothetical protein
MTENSTIAAMPLYTNLDRVARGLAALDLGRRIRFRRNNCSPSTNGTITAPRLSARPPNGWDWGLRVACSTSAQASAAPARYLAYRFGCHVTALELQPALHAIAVDLTQRSGLDKNVTHICADALTYAFPEAAFNAVVSWLAFLHIPDRPRARTLRPGGACYIEDLCMRAPFSAADLRDVRDVVFGISMTSTEDYQNDLRAAGLVDVETTDLTGDWSPYAADRLKKWRANHEAYARVHGAGAYAT